MSTFNKVTDELVQELKSVLGEKGVTVDPEKLDVYKTDEEGNSYWFHTPEVVVFPETTEQVAEVVKLANKYLVPITPRAAGSGVACGAIPVHGGMVMELDRMDKILKIDTDNMYAVVQTGVAPASSKRRSTNTACSTPATPAAPTAARSAATSRPTPAATRPSNTARRAIRFTA